MSKNLPETVCCHGMAISISGFDLDTSLSQRLHEKKLGKILETNTSNHGLKRAVVKGGR